MNETKNRQAPSNNPQVNYQHTYEMLNYFQDEYFRRHGHFWSALKMFFGLNIAISLLPFVSGILGIEIKNGALPIIIFPIVGILVAFTSFSILRREVESFKYIAQKKYQLSKMLPDEYQYIDKAKENARVQADKEAVKIETKKKEQKKGKEKNAVKLASKIKKSYLSYKLVWMNLLFQIVVAAISLVFCLV